MARCPHCGNLCTFFAFFRVSKKRPYKCPYCGKRSTHKYRKRRLFIIEFFSAIGLGLLVTFLVKSSGWRKGFEVFVLVFTVELFGMYLFADLRPVDE